MSIFNSIWGIIAIPLGYIMRYCYLLCDQVLHLPLTYVFALLLFTLVTKALLFPLSLKQQRSSAIMAVYNPMLQEISKKYEKDPERRAREIQKFQQEYGYSPTAGCLPLLIQFPVIFGLIEVIYRPLTYMLRIPSAVVSAFSSAVTNMEAGNRLIETAVIEIAKTAPEKLTALSVEGFTSADIAGYVQRVADLNMSIGSINLWETPKFAFNLMLLIPLFSVVTMVISQIITLKTSGTTTPGNSMITMTLTLSVMFAFFSFMYPAGFSLYWGFQNLVAIGQSFILRRIVNVDRIKAEKEAEIAEKRRAKKQKRTVKVKDESGQVVEKSLTPDELARLRLQKAREMVAARYEDQPAEEQDQQ